MGDRRFAQAPDELVLMDTPCIAERRVVYAGIRTRELAVAGSGPTVLLAHGFGDAADTWRPVMKFLHDAGQAAVAVDLPGFGRADQLAAGELLPQLDAFVAAAIRAHAGTKGVVVAGNSLGAAVAARAARNTDLPTAAVMPLDIAGITWTPVAASLRAVAAGLRIASAMPIPRRVHRGVLTWSLSRLLYGDRSAVDPAVVARFADNYPDAAAAHRHIRLGARFKAELDRERSHGGIGVPMTVIHGARDRLVPVSSSHILHQANPGSQLIVIDSSGHCPQLDAAAIVAHHAYELAVTSTADEEIS
jgi:pimeloyl-ACP methyl ester carboxylesterase